MYKVVRLIIYESDNHEILTKQIQQSLPLGVHNLAVKINIIELTNKAAEEVCDIFVKCKE